MDVRVNASDKKNSEQFYNDGNYDEIIYEKLKEAEEEMKKQQKDTL